MPISFRPDSRESDQGDRTARAPQYPSNQPLWTMRRAPGRRTLPVVRLRSGQRRRSVDDEDGEHGYSDDAGLLGDDLNRRGRLH